MSFKSFTSIGNIGKFHVQVALSSSFSVVDITLPLSPAVNDKSKYSGSGGPALYNSQETVSGAEWILTVSVSMISSPYFKVGLTTAKDSD